MDFFFILLLYGFFFIVSMWLFPHIVSAYQHTQLSISAIQFISTITLTLQIISILLGIYVSTYIGYCIYKKYHPTLHDIFLYTFLPFFELKHTLRMYRSLHTKTKKSSASYKKMHTMFPPLMADMLLAAQQHSSVPTIVDHLSDYCEKKLTQHHILLQHRIEKILFISLSSISVLTIFAFLPIIFLYI